MIGMGKYFKGAKIIKLNVNMTLCIETAWIDAKFVK